MQITVNLGLDEIPERVLRSLAKAGIRNHGGTVVVTEIDSNGDEVTMIYSASDAKRKEASPTTERALVTIPAPVSTPAPVQAQQQSRPGAQATHDVLSSAATIKRLQEEIRKETVWIGTEEQKIRLERNALSQLPLNDPQRKHRNDSYERRRKLLSQRAAAQGERRKMLKKAQGKNQSARTRSKRTSISSSSSVAPVAQQPLPSASVTMKSAPALPVYASVSAQHSLWNPTVHGPKLSVANKTSTLSQDNNIRPPQLWSGNFHSFIPVAKTFSLSPPKLGQYTSTLFEQKIHPDRVVSFGNFSREKQETSTFPSIPSFLDALGTKRTGANDIPVAAKRRQSPMHLRVNPSIVHGYDREVGCPLTNRTKLPPTDIPGLKTEDEIQTINSHLPPYNSTWAFKQSAAEQAITTESGNAGQSLSTLDTVTEDDQTDDPITTIVEADLGLIYPRHITARSLGARDEKVETEISLTEVSSPLSSISSATESVIFYLGQREDGALKEADINRQTNIPNTKATTSTNEKEFEDMFEV